MKQSSATRPLFQLCNLIWQITSLEHEVEVIEVMMALYDRDTYMGLFEAEKEREGEARFATLITKLLSMGRNKDVEEAAKDEAYRKQLFAEFGIV